MAFALWVLFQAWKGFRGGLWLSLLSLFGFASAYLVTFLWGSDVSDYVASLGFDHEHRLFIVYPLLFLSVSALIRHVPPMAFPFLKRRTRATVLGGISLGAVSGIFTGLIGIWFIGLAQAAVSSKSDLAEGDAGTEVVQSSKKQALLETVAANLVAESAEIGLKLAGTNTFEAELSANVIRHPNEAMSNLHRAMSSQEMRTVMLSTNTQGMMAINDSGSLRSSDEFQDLMAQDEMQNMIAMLAVDGKSQADAEQFISEQVTFVWRRLQYLKNDARVQDVLKDEEIQALLREEKFSALMMNAKFQSLVGIVLDKKQDMSKIDFSKLMSEQASSSSANVIDNGEMPIPKVPEKYSPMEVYKWVDDQGNVQYSDKEQVPERFIESAQKMLR